MKGTELLLKITIPKAADRPRISEVENELKRALEGSGYKTRKVRVEDYAIVEITDPVGIYYTGYLTVRVLVEGEIPLNRGDKFRIEGGKIVSVRGAVGIIAVIAAAILAILVAKNAFIEVLEASEKFLESSGGRLYSILLSLVPLGILTVVLAWLLRKR